MTASQQNGCAEINIILKISLCFSIKLNTDI